MDTRTRLKLCLALAFGLMFCASSALMYRSLMADARSEVRRESLLRMETALAVRAYTIEEVRPLLQQHGELYREPAVPAHAAIRVMELLEHDHPSYRYQEVALEPTNPSHRAQGWQLGAISRFRDDPSLRELTVMTDAATGPVMNVLRPVRPTSDCMACHGALDHAPAELLQRYGRNGFGWKVGDTVGAQIVSVPTAHAYAQAREAWGWHVAAMLAVFGVLFLVLDRMLGRGVIGPIESRSRAWRTQARTDALTGALNRRSFGEQAAGMVARAHAEGLTLALVAVDVDHFKRVNDTHGHAAGDAVLQELVRRLRAGAGDTASVYRLGGEEFALMLPGADESRALALATTLRASLAAHPFQDVGALTASFGVALLAPGDTAQTLMQRADRALYLAKDRGRDRVEMATRA